MTVKIDLSYMHPATSETLPWNKRPSTSHEKEHMTGSTKDRMSVFETFNGYDVNLHSVKEGSPKNVHETTLPLK